MTKLPDTPLFTIGHGARTIEELIALLLRYHIDFVVDVRSQPYSSIRPDFSKQPLQSHLERASIRYVFMGDTLGGRPVDQSCYVNGKVDYQIVASKPFYQAGIERLSSALDQQLRVALLCSEGKPQECHRSKLIGQTLTDKGIAISHIDENGDIKSQGEVMLELTHGQQSMFGPAPVVASSKKKYRTPSRRESV